MLKPFKKKVTRKKGSKKRPYTEDEKDDDYKPDEPNRARETKKAVLVRDGDACIFLRTSNPEVAHIIPASSDFPWNAICLKHQLHFWFENRLIGLKFLGSQSIGDNPPMSEVDIQFHWMMRDIRKRTRKMDIGTENDSFMGMVETVCTFQDNGYPTPQLPSQDGIVGVFNAIDGIPLISGRVIKLRLPSKDVSKLTTAVDIQCACTNIASMAGSAGWPEYTSHYDDDDDDDERGSMLAREWVLEQSILQLLSSSLMTS
ncbi:hypothetical protein FPRO04_07010 [Fusarium proliferatum]|nr:hypothetical protein FPRO04_07010 [Fusarium proliferatum]